MILFSVLWIASAAGAPDLTAWQTTLRVAETRLDQLARSAETIPPSQLDRWLERAQRELTSVRRQLKQVEIERRELVGLRRFQPDWRWWDRELGTLTRVRSGVELAGCLDRFVEELALWHREAVWMGRLPAMRVGEEGRAVVDEVLREGDYDLAARRAPSRWESRLNGLQRFIESLFGLLRSSNGRVRAAWTQLLASVLTFGASLFVVVVAVRALGRRLRGGTGIELRDASLRQRPPQLLRAGDRARRSLEGRDAIACYFRMAIATLAERGWLRRRTSATGNDYARELRDRSRPVAEAFEGLQGIFEAVTYGGREPDDELIQSFRKSALALVSREARS